MAALDYTIAKNGTGHAPAVFFSHADGRPYPPKERRRVARLLRAEFSWSQERIAAAMRVSQATVCRDLQEQWGRERVETLERELAYAELRIAQLEGTA